MTPEQERALARARARLRTQAVQTAVPAPNAREERRVGGLPGRDGMEYFAPGTEEALDKFIRTPALRAAAGVASLPNLLLEQAPAFLSSQAGKLFGGKTDVEPTTLLPSYQEVSGAIERATGFDDVPAETRAGRIAQGGIAGLFATPGTAGLGFAAGAGSEAAGQAVEGTPAEPYVRGATALAPFAAKAALAPRVPQLSREAVRTAPTTQQLKTQAVATKNAAKATDVAVPPNEMTGFARGVSQELFEEGLNAQAHPGTVGLVRDMIGAKIVDDVTGEVIEGNLGPRELMALRNRASGIARQMDNGVPTPDAAMASKVIDALDEFVEGGQGQIYNKRRAFSQEWRKFREEWRRVRKSDLIDTAFYNASLAKSGFENGLRDEFKRILRNPNLSRGFKPDEIKAMEDVVRGTPTRNTIRRLASMGPGRGIQRTMFNFATGSAAGGGLGFAFGGPVGAALMAPIPPILGSIAGKASEALTRNSALNARARVAGVVPQPGILPRPGLLNSAPLLSYEVQQ